MSDPWPTTRAIRPLTPSNFTGAADCTGTPTPVKESSRLSWAPAQEDGPAQAPGDLVVSCNGGRGSKHASMAAFVEALWCNQLH